MKIHGIIVSYNGESCISKSISSLLASTLPIKIIVVDNNSLDNTVSIINKFEGIELIQNKINLGFGMANNLGIQKAIDDGADYVFLLNQDAWIEPDTILTLINTHVNNKDYGILSPINLDERPEGEMGELEKNDKFSKFLTEENCPGFISDFVIGQKKNINPKELYNITFLPASTWLISKECLLKVGGFDPIFFHYGEDVNYVQRVKYHNLKVGLCTNAVAHHFREKTKHNANPYLEHFAVFERQLKLNLGDINQNNYSAIMAKYLRCYWLRMILCLFSLNNQGFWENKKYFTLCKQNSILIKQSREKNVLQGLNYLSKTFKNEESLIIAQ